MTAFVESAGGSPLGTVEFFDSGVLIGSGKLTPVSGKQVAIFTTSILSIGNHPITASYTGTGNFDGSDSAASTVTGQRDRDHHGHRQQPDPIPLRPAGDLHRDGRRDDGRSHRNGDLLYRWHLFRNKLAGEYAGQQTATFTPLSLGVGSFTISASYNASGSFAGSSSTNNLTQVVSPATTITSISSNIATTVFSQPVTFTAAVDSTAGAPTGTVSFFDGAILLGTGTLTTAGGRQLATLTLSSLGVGTHAISANYEASGNFAGDASPGMTHTVSIVPTGTALTASPNPSDTDDTVTFTAVVSVASGLTVTPTGTVTFKAGTDTLGTAPLVGNTATFTTADLPVGKATITATYAGDATTTTSSGSVNVEVTGPTSPPVPPTTPPVALVGEREFGVGAGAGFAGIARFYNPDATERYSVNAFPGFTGGVRVTSADFNGDGIADLVAGSGPGSASRGGHPRWCHQGRDLPHRSVRGPVRRRRVRRVRRPRTATARPTSSSRRTRAAGRGCASSAATGFGLMADFFGIDDPDFRGGARAAIGDVNGDGIGDLVVAAGFLGGPRVAGFAGKSLGSRPPHQCLRRLLRLRADACATACSSRSATSTATATPR